MLIGPYYRSVSVLRKTKSDLRSLFLIMLLWGVPVVLTLLSGPRQNVIGSAIIAGIASCVMIVFKPKVSLIALPFFALLSPVAGFFNVFGTHLLLSDLLFILFAFQITVLFLKKDIKIYKSSLYSLQCILLILFSLSIVIGTISGTLVSLKPVLLLLQLVIIYYYMTIFAKDERGWSLVINAWVVATCLGSLLLIQAFMTGKYLANFKYLPDSELAGIKNPDKIDFLIQATYYYTTFHFVLGLSIIVMFFKMHFSKSMKRLFILIPLMVCLLALVLLQNKTAIFSMVISILLYVIFFARLNKKTLKTLIPYVVFLVSFFVLLIGGIFFYIGDIQAGLWVNRLITASSFHERIVNYFMAFKSWFAFPYHWLTGMGPDFLDSSGNTGIALSFKVSGEDLWVGTIDSGWISYLIELGIFGFITLILLFIKSITEIIKRLKRMSDMDIADSTSPYVLVGILFLTIALSTQMLGYTKLAWFPFQLLIIGLMHKQSGASTSRNETDIRKERH